MANGKPGDHPITDLMAHGQHSMPEEIEELIRTLWALRPPNFDPHDPVWDDIYHQAFEWEQGRNVNEGKALLESRIESVK